MDLQTLANLAEVLGGVTIIGGAAFGLVQLREFRAQRRQAVAVEITRSFQSPELIRAINVVRALPDGLSAREIRELGSDVEDAALTVALTLETIAILVFERLASFRMVREIAGGIVLVFHRKLSGWIEDVRREQAQPSWAEWFEWLVEQMRRDAEQKEANPAYLQHEGWRPRE